MASAGRPPLAAPNVEDVPPGGRWMFVELLSAGGAWSYATSSPQYDDSPFYTAEANVCTEEVRAPPLPPAAPCAL